MLSIPPILLVFLIGSVAAVAGVWLEERRRASRWVVLASGVVLIGMSFFWVVPEIAAHAGRVYGLAWVVGGFGLLWGVNHWLYPVCPSCSHSHDHHGCRTMLHGFAWPLMAFASLHSFVDGWSLFASRESGIADLQLAFAAGILVHKMPEGLAMGGLLRAAVATPLRAVAGALSIQAMTLVGFGLAGALAGFEGPKTIGAMLGLAGGAFLYLGVHALEGAWPRRVRAAEARGVAVPE